MRQLPSNPSLESLLGYENYYRAFGIQRINQFLSPKARPLSQLELPRDALLHYVDDAYDAPLLDPTLRLFDHYRSKILVDYVTEYKGSTKGVMRKLSTPPQTIYRGFHRDNPNFYLLRSPIGQVTNPNTLVVVNYNLLPHLYRYGVSPLIKYYQWYDLYSTVWATMSELARTTTRQQYLIIKIPPSLPSFNLMRAYAKVVNANLLRLFETSERLNVLEIWKWLNPVDRPESMLQVLSTEDLRRINIILQYRSTWTTINLGQLDSWIEKPVKDPVEVKGLRLPPLQIQKLFTKLMITVQSRAGGYAPTDTTEPLSDDPVDQSGLGISNDELGKRTGPGVPESALGLGPDPETISAADRVHPDEAAPVVDQSELDQMLEEIDSDLEILEQQEKRFVSKSILAPQDAPPLESDADFTDLYTPKEHDVRIISQAIHGVESHHDIIKKQVDTLADFGLVNVNDYRKTLEDLEASDQLPDPYSKSDRPLKDLVDIPREELLIDADKSEIKLDLPAVFDKSMTRSSLLAMDSHYAEHILRRDILSSVHAIQKAGVIIQEYTVEEDHSILGHYENHTIRIKPIDGAPSTLRFRLPTVTEGNDYMVNGNRYVMRKNRADVPIRKIRPDEVGLTSYYGKTFITRNSKVAYNTGEYLSRHILKQGLESDTGTITQVAPSDVFYPDVKLPKIYTTLAMHFKGFNISGMAFDFDYRDRHQLVSEDVLTTVESLGGAPRVIVGLTNRGEPITVDYADQFHIAQMTDSGYQLQTVGDIYQILGLAPQSAPVDSVYIRIFAKSIPIVIALGYLLGLSNLIKYLGVRPTVIDVKKRYTPTRDEYVLTFKNKRLVFNRTDRRAALIFAGLIEYRGVIKNYHLESFEQPNVYLNLLESKGIPGRYITELDNLDHLFIDPITLGILKEMHEPTTFKGLMFRSVELLMTDDHPVSQDIRYQRVRGYERFAGTVYRELINSVRDYRNRNIRAKSQISLNPLAVWIAIKDQSTKLVEDVNPIADLKEQESVTYLGTGGRSKDAINKASRAYHPSEMGVISEATVDSGDVSVNTYLSADPKFINVRGMVRGYDASTDGPTSLISTSALLTPSADHDDAKRVLNCSL